MKKTQSTHLTTTRLHGPSCFFVLVLTVFFAAETAQAQSAGWTQVTGLASGISGGADGSVWTIGRSGKRVYRVASDQSSVKHSFDERGTNPVIAVCADNQGWPYVVARSKEIFRKKGTRPEDPWEQVPGFAINLGAGLDGSLWTVGKSGKRVFKLAADGTGTKHSFDEQGTDPVVAVAADAQGNPVVVTQSQKIFKQVGGQWQPLPGAALNISRGAGALWTVGKSGKRVFRLSSDGSSSERFSFDEQGADPILGGSAFGDNQPIVVVQSQKIYDYQDAAGCTTASTITWSDWLGRDDLNGQPAGSAESPVEQCPSGLASSGFQVYSRTCSAANLRAAPLVCDDNTGNQRQLIDNGWGYRGGCSVCLVYTTECPDGWHAVGVNVHDGAGGRGGEPKPICQQACNGPTQSPGGCSSAPVNQTFRCPQGQRIVAFQQRGGGSGDRGSYEFRVGCR